MNILVAQKIRSENNFARIFHNGSSPIWTYGEGDSKCQWHEVCVLVKMVC